jgi:hypothetical protein
LQIDYAVGDEPRQGWRGDPSARAGSTLARFAGEGLERRAHSNPCHIHKTLPVAPVMTAGMTDRLRHIADIANLREGRDDSPR